MDLNLTYFTFQPLLPFNIDPFDLIDVIDVICILSTSFYVWKVIQNPYIK
jgi:hypothetical protein